MSPALPAPQDSATVPTLAVAGEFNIFTALQTRAQLLDAIAAGPAAPDGEITVDLSQVTDVDSAGLQLMLAARSEARRQGKRLRFAPCSPCVSDIVSLCGLAQALELTTPALTSPAQP